jgi:argininosuccinate lyase
MAHVGEKQHQSGSQKLWGGRFAKDTDARAKAWCDSAVCDEKMAVEDMWGSMGHVTMLGLQGIIPEQDAKAILGALKRLHDGYVAGQWHVSDKGPFETHDDVHMNVEARVIADVGMEAGGKMHTTRSRNDQVIVSSKMAARKRIAELREGVLNAAQAFFDRAAEYVDDPMVAYTHVQHAQPVSIGFWLSHYGAILLRDAERLKRAYDITDQNPLGSGAICTTSFNVDRKLTTKLLGFQKVHLHALDATSSRDYMLEVLSSIAILQTTLSRLAEEFILWSSFEFRTLTLDDGFAMGSSMMPQKKNPGTLELLRGRTGRLDGLLMAGLTMMKGLPSGYNRDFHEEKELVFEALDMEKRAIGIVPALIATTQINKERMRELTFGNFSTATELANFLVRRGIPFRQAHHIVGSLVGELTARKQNFGDYATVQAHLATNNIQVTLDEVRSVLDGAIVMTTYNVEGGTSPSAVRSMLTIFQEEMVRLRAELQADNDRRARAYQLCLQIAETGNLELARSL